MKHFANYNHTSCNALCIYLFSLLPSKLHILKSNILGLFSYLLYSKHPQQQDIFYSGSGRDYFDAMFNDVSSKSTMYKKLSETKYGGSSVQQDLINSTARLVCFDKGVIECTNFYLKPFLNPTTTFVTGLCYYNI